MNKESDVLFIGLIVLLIYLVILYVIIRSANDTSKRDKIQKQNQKLLALIAEKLGVDVERIKKVLNE